MPRTTPFSLDRGGIPAATSERAARRVGAGQPDARPRPARTTRGPAVAGHALLAIACLLFTSAMASAADQAPSFVFDREYRNVRVGHPTTFAVLATGSPAPTYQWRRNGVDIPGANSASYTTVATDADRASPQVFTVVISNRAGSATSNQMGMNVQNAQDWPHDAFDYVVFVEATVQANPPAITLTWPGESNVSGFYVSRKLRTDTAWTPMASLPGSATTWTDTSVSAGVKYEYQVRRPITAPYPEYPYRNYQLSGWGYVCTGINVPVIDRRGTVILVVDNTMTAALANELTRLHDDLVGDGWSVIRHDFARGSLLPYPDDPNQPASPGDVVGLKAMIKADYDANPSDVKAVFLIGHVPVPRSGDIAPAGHGQVLQGAFSADLYYGEMDGVWTDTTVNDSKSGKPATWNVPGDGKFDQSVIPSRTVELAVGRVDLSQLGQFWPKTETDLLRQYLDKDHQHRHALRVLPRRALVDLTSASGYAPAQGFKAGCALFGKANTVDGGSLCLAHDNEYMLFSMDANGMNDRLGEAYTPDFARIDPKYLMAAIGGSGFGDWDYPDNVLRAQLATTTCLMTYYTATQHVYMHNLAMGESFGDMIRLIQHNGYADPNKVDNYGYYGNPVPIEEVLYNGPEESYAGCVNITLHGDPTLRLFTVAPPSSLTIAADGANHPALSWTASPDASLGYHVYRSTSAEGPFVRVTANPVNATNWTDAAVSSGTFTYQVKAAKLDSTTGSGGTFVNTSQALTGTIALGGSGNNPPTSDAGPNQSITLPTNAVTLSGSGTDSDGTIVGYAWTQVSGPSTAAIAAPTSASTTAGSLVQGTYVFRLTVTDNGGATGSDTVQVTVNAASGGASPAWASASGTDAYGRWADLTVGPNTQRMRYIPPGTFVMGSPITESKWRYEHEAQHHVVITHGYWLGESEVTQAMWQGVTGSNPSANVGGDLPVDRASWDATASFFAAINARKPGLGLTFPTEAQYEYACRAGTTGPFYGDPFAIMWFWQNNTGNTHPVKMKAANPWGLYDIEGNVMEWCSDWFENTLTYPVVLVDPPGPASGTTKVLKGGWYPNDETWNRAATGYFWAPSAAPVNAIGLRMYAPADDAAAPGTIAMSGPTYSVVEGTGGTTSAAVAVVRYGGSLGTVSISYTISDGTASAGSDYSATSSGTLTWGDGDTSAKLIPITIVADSNVEPDETIQIALSSPTGGAALARSSAVLTIVNDDAPSAAGLLAFTATEYTYSEQSAFLDTMAIARISVSRVGGSSGQVTVDYSTADGTAVAGRDYTATSGTLTWANGDSSVQFFEVPIAWDSTTDPDQTVLLSLRSATGGATLGTANATLDILGIGDGSAAHGSLGFASTSSSVLEGNSGTTLATISVARTGGSNGAVTVHYATADGTATAGSDYAATSGTLTWADGDTAAKILTVAITGDTTVEPDESILITLSGATGGATLGAANATLTITNDDTASGGTLAFSNATYAQAEGDSGTTNATITVTRAGGTAGAVSVHYQSADGTATAGSDYTAASGTLTWADQDGAAKTFTIAIAGDTTVEPNETVLLTLSGPTGGATLGAANATLTITNDDAPAAGVIAFISGTYATIEGNSGTTPATISVTRVGGSTGAVTVHYQSANGTASAGSDYTAVSGTLSWPDGDAAAKTFTIDIAGDTIAEADETVLLTLSAPTGGAALGTANATLTITNDDGTPNVPPIVNAGLDQAITLPTATVTLSGTASDRDGTIASYAWSQVSGPSAATIAASSSATTSAGALVEGVYLFRLTATDNLGASASDTVQVTVHADTVTGVQPSMGPPSVYQHHGCGMGAGLGAVGLVLVLQGRARQRDRR